MGNNDWCMLLEYVCFGLTLCLGVHPFVMWFFLYKLDECNTKREERKKPKILAGPTLPLPPPFPWPAQRHALLPGPLGRQAHARPRPTRSFPPPRACGPLTVAAALAQLPPPPPPACPSRLRARSHPLPPARGSHPPSRPSLFIFSNRPSSPSGTHVARSLPFSSPPSRLSPESALARAWLRHGPGSAAWRRAPGGAASRQRVASQRVAVQRSRPVWWPAASPCSQRGGSSASLHGARGS
jgi:hypothetical protein